MQNQAYTLRSDTAPRSCAVFSSPHSGAEYPDAFLQASCLTPQKLRSSEDAFVAEFCPETRGAPVIAARLPRAYVDLNRAADELDPAVIDGAKGPLTNPRIAAGLGVIPRVVANGCAIYRGKISTDEANARLSHVYHPYHQALAGLITAQKQRFGCCYVFDLHSMPRSALPKLPLTRRPEVVLGDRYGTTCDPWLMSAVVSLFEAAGFRVARNAPFAGGYITRHYGAPGNGVHAIQIEVDRSLYMDEQKIEPRRDYAAFLRRISGVMAQLASLQPCGQRLAAE